MTQLTTPPAYYYYYYPSLLCVILAILLSLPHIVPHSTEAYILKDLFCISLPVLCPPLLIHTNKGLPMDIASDSTKDCPFCALAASPPPETLGASSSKSGKNRLVYQVFLYLLALRNIQH